MAGIEPLRLDDAVWDQLDLGPNTRSFFKRVYGGGLEKYERRLRALGFAGGRRGLDAGCGGGQWTLALAGMCDEVWGVDVENDRIEACKGIAARMRKTNAHFKRGGLEQLPLASASFDRILCYSVLYQTNFERAIAELARVAQRDGLLYLSTNDVGRFVQHVVSPTSSVSDFDERSYGWNTLANSLRNKRQGLSMQTGGVVTRKQTVLQLLREAGFEIIASGPEGTIGGASESFLSGSYMGLRATYDVLARRA